jgi:hypothetical protein
MSLIVNSRIARTKYCQEQTLNLFCPIFSGEEKTCLMALSLAVYVSKLFFLVTHGHKSSSVCPQSMTRRHCKVIHIGRLLPFLQKSLSGANLSAYFVHNISDEVKKVCNIGTGRFINPFLHQQVDHFVWHQDNRHWQNESSFATSSEAIFLVMCNPSMNKL